MRFSSRIVELRASIISSQGGYGSSRSLVATLVTIIIPLIIILLITMASIQLEMHQAVEELLIVVVVVV